MATERTSFSDRMGAGGGRGWRGSCACRRCCLCLSLAQAWVPGECLGKSRTVTIADLEPLFGRRCTVHAATPGLRGGLALTGVLERVDDGTIAVRATSPYGGNVQPYPGGGKIALVTVTGVELA
jgi:hypothetical protein